MHLHYVRIENREYDFIVDTIQIHVRHCKTGWEKYHVNTNRHFQQIGICEKT